VIFDGELLDACDDVEMAHLHVVVDAALGGIDDAETDAHSFADLVTEEQAIEGTLEERRQDRAYRQHQQTQFAWSMHSESTNFGHG